MVKNGVGRGRLHEAYRDTAFLYTNSGVELEMKRK
jgi:hypothetical protein